MTGLEVVGLTSGYGKKEIVKNASFKVESGRVTGLIGANGSGKTTLIKTVANILSHRGESFVDGKRLEDMSALGISRLCSYIPQRSGISIDISALDVVLMGLNPYLGIFERPSEDMIKKAEESLRLVGIESLKDENYMKLSEGQKSLCILARALVSSPRLYLMDEPESALDFSVRHRMLSLIKRRAVDDGSCVLVSLHDPSLALNYCDELLLLKDGEIVDRAFPMSDSVTLLEKKLSVIYGNVSILKCTLESGRERLCLLTEEDV